MRSFTARLRPAAAPPNTSEQCPSGAGYILSARVSTWLAAACFLLATAPAPASGFGYGEGLTDELLGYGYGEAEDGPGAPGAPPGALHFARPPPFEALFGFPPPLERGAPLPPRAPPPHGATDGSPPPLERGTPPSPPLLAPPGGGGDAGSGGYGYGYGFAPPLLLLPPPTAKLVPAAPLPPVYPPPPAPPPRYVAGTATVRYATVGLARISFNLPSKKPHLLSSSLLYFKGSGSAFTYGLGYPNRD